MTNAAAKAGDRIVITKPLGTGIAATAIKAGRCPEPVRTAVTESMVSLNAHAAAAMVEIGVNAATDVTGFGLGGHLLEMLTGSGLSATIESGSVPVFEGVRDLLDAGHFPGGSARNLAAIDPHVRGEVDHDVRRLIADAQTSGGLLISVPDESTDDLLSEISARGSEAWVIGTMTADTTGTITLR